jgi:hypothetical protein
MTFKKTYIENDVPSMKKPAGMLDHHPHKGFPSHGKIMLRSGKTHLLDCITKPKKG